MEDLLKDTLEISRSMQVQEGKLPESKVNEKGLTTDLVMDIVNTLTVDGTAKVRISDITREVARKTGVDYEEVSKFVRDTLSGRDWETGSYEGKVPEEGKDDEATKIKKLTEQDDDFEPEIPGEPKDEPKDEPEEKERDLPTPKIRKPKDEDEAPEITKELIGSTEDTFYYMISVEDDDGEIKDLSIVDQEGVEKYSAREHGLEVANIPEFLFKGIKELEIQELEFGMFDRYLYPYVFEEEEKEEDEDEEVLGDELEELPKESKDGEKNESKEVSEEVEKSRDWLQAEVETALNALDPDIPVDAKKIKLVFSKVHAGAALQFSLILPLIKHASVFMLKTILDILGHDVGIADLPVESKKHLIEMKVVDHQENTFDVYLVDDGTLDTVIDVNGKEFRFDQEFASFWRDDEGDLSDEGLRELALDALSDLGEDDYNELVARGAEGEDAEIDDSDVDYWDTPDRPTEESKVAEANMGVDYIKRAKQGMKDVVAAMKEKDFDAVAKHLEDVADDCNDGAKAAKKMKVVADEKEAKAAEDEKEVKEEDSSAKEAPEEEIKEEETVDEKKPPTCSKCNKAHWPFQKCGAKEEAEDTDEKCDKKYKKEKVELEEGSLETFKEQIQGMSDSELGQSLNRMIKIQSEISDLAVDQERKENTDSKIRMLDQEWERRGKEEAEDTDEKCDKHKKKKNECVCHIYGMKDDELLEFYKNVILNPKHYISVGAQKQLPEDKVEVEKEIEKRGLVDKVEKTNESKEKPTLSDAMRRGDIEELTCTILDMLK